jgi:RNA polymerase sigma-70 factor, ECF subfamily
LTAQVLWSILSIVKAMRSAADEASLLESLRVGDETAFASLVEEYHLSLVRLARLYVRDEAIAEELAQDTWLAVLNGLSSFEGRSSLKTWIFTILTNKAKTRGQREKRSLVFSDVGDASDSPTVAPERFNDPSAERWPNHWATEAAPVSWIGIPEEIFLSGETMNLIRHTIDELPESQRMVITLRDVDEISSQEICNILDISETNQRVLLHRARARVRQALENYLKSEH